MTEFRIRKFQSADATVVLSMLEKLAAFHGDKAFASIDQVLQECDSSSLIACHEESVIGFLISYDWMNFIRGKKIRHIDLIFIEEPFRNKGIGKMLIKYCAQSALEDGCQRLDVGALESNTDANKFYSALGFESSTINSMKYRIQDNALADLAKF